MGLWSAQLWLAYKNEKVSLLVQNWMKNILLRPDILRNESIIVIPFSYDIVFIACVKTIENSGWSQTLSTWYVKKKDFDLHRVFNTLYVCAEWAQLKKRMQTLENDKREQKFLLSGNRALQIGSLFSI